MIERSDLTVVCDAGPLIHLDEIDSLDLLADFRAVLVPNIVAAEVRRHRPAALGPSSPVAFEWVEVEAASRFRALASAFQLDPGELAALTVLAEHPGALLLTDDAAARVAAKALGVRAHGTLGVLLRALRRGSRTKMEVLQLLRGLPERSTLHLRREILADVIREVEQRGT